MMAGTQDAASAATGGRFGQEFVPAVQGLRGVAALSVIVVHLYGMPYLAGLLPPDLPAWAHATINTGGRGVELFFIISGYLIPASLVRHRVLSKFFYDRAMRIMPLFVLLHLALFIVGPLVGYKFFPELDLLGYVRAFLANLFFVPQIVGEPIGQQNAWTLTYEWAFYIWFAAVYFLVATRRSWWAAVPLLVLAAISAVAFPIVTYFAVGMALAWFRFRIGWRGLPGALAGTACVAAVYYACEYVTPYAGLMPAALAFAMVLHRGSGFAHLLETRPLQFVGKVSYSLYLVHPFVFFPLLAVAKRIAAHGVDPWIVWLGFAAAGAAASIGVATISYELVEVRLRRWLHGLFTDRATAPIAAEGVRPQG